MRIAQVAPLYESVPPKLYGGTERVVSYLTEELVRQGHEVTLFASGDSQTNARLVPACPKALWRDQTAAKRCRITFGRWNLFSKTSPASMSSIFTATTCTSHSCGVSHVRTLRRCTGGCTCRTCGRCSRNIAEMPLVSISDNQRRPMPWANWRATVHHGLPRDLHTFRPRSRNYLAFLGRISPEKRLDRAIAIALRSG